MLNKKRIKEKMRIRLITIAFILLTCFVSSHAAGWIRINQLGYLPNATKVAVLMSQESVQISGFELVDAYTAFFPSTTGCGMARPTLC